jgi:hypothetical protein
MKLTKKQKELLEGWNIMLGGKHMTYYINKKHMPIHIEIFRAVTPLTLRVKVLFGVHICGNRFHNFDTSYISLTGALKAANRMIKEQGQNEQF